MSVASIGSSNVTSLGQMLLQELTAGGSSTSGSSSLGGGGDAADLLSLSNASQSMSQAPAAVTQAMGDLLGSQTDVQGDLTQLKGYFQDNPAALTNVLQSLQGTGTYDASGSLASGSSDTSSLLASLLASGSGSSGDASLLGSLLGSGSDGSDNSSLVASLLGSGSQDPLLAALSGSDSSSSLSLLA